jgi:hypothetical protein
MKWMLVIVVLGWDGNTSTTVPMENERACLVAKLDLAKELESVQGARGLRVYAACLRSDDAIKLTR